MGFCQGPVEIVVFIIIIIIIIINVSPIDSMTSFMLSIHRSLGLPLFLFA